MYTLSTWYTKEELTKRIAVFFFGMFGGSAVAPLLGAGLLKLDGRGGLAGWKWIFLCEIPLLCPSQNLTLMVCMYAVEGCWSVLVSIFLFTLLPEHTSPTQSDEESSQPSKEWNESPNAPLPLSTIYKTLTNYKKYPHFLATGCVFSTWSPLTTYTPSIIMSLGFSRINANALAAIGNLLTLPVIVFFAWVSDRTRQRGLTVMLSIGCYLVALVLLRCLQAHVGKWGKFGLWTTVNGLAVGYHPIHNAWIQVNCGSPGERSVSVA